MPGGLSFAQRKAALRATSSELLRCHPAPRFRSVSLSQCGTREPAHLIALKSLLQAKPAVPHRPDCADAPWLDTLCGLRAARRSPYNSLTAPHHKALYVPQLVIQVLVFTITHRDRARHRGAQTFSYVLRGLFPLVDLLVFIGALLACVFLAVVFALSTPVTLLNQPDGIFASAIQQQYRMHLKAFALRVLLVARAAQRWRSCPPGWLSISRRRYACNRWPPNHPQ